LLQLLLS